MVFNPVPLSDDYQTTGGDQSYPHHKPRKWKHRVCTLHVHMNHMAPIPVLYTTRCFAVADTNPQRAGYQKSMAPRPAAYTWGHPPASPTIPVRTAATPPDRGPGRRKLVHARHVSGPGTACTREGATELAGSGGPRDIPGKPRPMPYRSGGPTATRRPSPGGQEGSPERCRPISPVRGRTWMGRSPLLLLLI